MENTVIILYASQTGTSESYARDCAKLLEVEESCVQSIEGYSVEDLMEEERIVLFLCSTIDSGNPPDSMEEFWADLCSMNEEEGNETSFAKLKYSTFGIGNSQYGPTYQAIPRKLRQILNSFGAVEFVPCIEGDTSCNLNDSFDAWILSLKSYQAK